ncbi:hypothetical protein [Rhodoferax ferrireducens]|uniref:hypothetical protein n=1 Tax=Rhodoferax ferrireducens TaxID=192843 RepID=UPI000E0D1EAA|nr:hypothetical protein [Rhodoferax ferrireducens]
MKKTTTELVLEALETAKNGLLWYADRHPTEQNGCDDEAMTEIDRAIAALEQDIAQPVEPVGITADAVNRAIYAVDREAARRGEMFPQTRDEQDRRAVSRVMGMITWYEKNTGCTKIKNWPVAPQEAASPATVNAELLEALKNMLSMPQEDDAESTAERIVRIGRAHKAIAKAIRSAT